MEAIGIDEIIRKTVAEYRRQERDESGQHPSGCWACPVCRNWFSVDDGSLVCTHDKTGTCKCPDMPAHLRRIRDIDLLRRAVTLGTVGPEKVDALNRILEALHGNL
jgi:hypothetical protein